MQNFSDLEASAGGTMNLTHLIATASIVRASQMSQLRQASVLFHSLVGQKNRTVVWVDSLLCISQGWSQGIRSLGT